MSSDSVNPAAFAPQIKTFDFNQMSSGAAGADSGGLFSDAVSASVAKLRAHTAEMSQNYEAVAAEELNKPNLTDDLKASYSGTDVQSAELRAEFSSRKVQSEMPIRSEIEASTARNIAVLERMSTISQGAMTFTVGTSIATKADGSIKMFVQAQ